jgi:hypothetical protein
MAHYKMPVVYKWEWLNEDGSERKVEINTSMGKEVARQRALSYFPSDQVALEYIKNNEPEEIQAE